MADSTLSNLTSLTLPSQATDLLLVGRGTARPNKVAMSDALNSSALAATTSTYGVAQLAASGGTTAGTVVQATDARLSDARNPPDGSKGDITVSGSGSTWTIKTNPTLSGNVTATGKITAQGTTAFPYEGQLIAANSSPLGTNAAVSQAIFQSQPGYSTFVGTTADGTAASYRTGGLGGVILDQQGYVISDAARGLLLHSINGPTIFATQNTGSEKMRLLATGTLLLGTTTDNALGKLQVSGAITSTETGGTGLFGFFGGSSLVVGTLGSASMVLRTNNTAALTLDNGQNASFTGNVQVPADKGLYLKQGNVFRFTSDGTTAGTARADMYADSGGAWFLRTGGATQALTVNSSQFSTFAKDIQFQGGSGPNIGQMLAARAPKQGVVTNGTFGVGVGAAVSPFGTADFTLAFIVRRDTNAVQQYLVGNDIGQCLYVGFRTNGDIFSGQAGGTPNADLSLATPLGRPFHLVLVRSAGTITAYVNALSSATVSDSKNYTGAANTLFAADSAGSASLDGLGIVQGFYNRALSATEVRELYEMGTPNQSERAISGSIAPSNTGLTTSTAAQNFQYDTFSGSTNGFTAVETGGQACEANFVSGTTFLGRAMKGARYLIQFTATLTSGAVPTVRLSTQGVSGVSSAIVNVSAGANAVTLQTTEPFTAETGTGAGRITFATSANTSYAISGLTVTRLGAILAPDANQQGGGSTWYDTSGNGNNITLPANGVAWNVPFNGRMQFGDGTYQAPSMTFANDPDTGFYKVSAATDIVYFGAGGQPSLRFVGGGTLYSGLSNAYLQFPSGGAVSLNADALTNSNISLSASGTGAVVFNATNILFRSLSGSSEWARFNNVGTLTIATATDSGNGKIQLGTHTTSAGGIGFGTDVSLYRSAASTVTIGGNLVVTGTITPSGGGGSTNVWIPASQWIPRTTTGCGVDSTETTTNRQNFDQLLFDAATDEFAQALVVMPTNYNAGQVTGRFYWTATTGSGAVVWGLQGLAYSDDDALDTATGTAQTVTDTLLAANDMMISGATSAITIGGTPGANKAVQFQIYRDADAGGDTLAVDARLLGVEISYTAS